MQTEILQFAQAAPAQPSLGEALMQMLPMMAFIFIIFYFVYQKPMQKEQDDHRKMINSLIKGDWVITIGGVVAQIVSGTSTFGAGPMRVRFASAGLMYFVRTVRPALGRKLVEKRRTLSS